MEKGSPDTEEIFGGVGAPGTATTSCLDAVLSEVRNHQGASSMFACWMFHKRQWGSTQPKSARW